MYNDNERNSYEPNYSYRPNYDEPLPTPEGNPNTEPKKSNHKMAKRVTAIVLCRGTVNRRLLWRRVVDQRWDPG